MWTSIVVPDEETSQTGQRSIWLPTECWVDTLKLLSRRQLLRRVQPACRRLHAIAELHVPSKHIVRHFGQFLDGLERNLPEVIRHYEELVLIKADLARYFRMRADVTLKLRRPRTQICMMRHSLELFHGCKLYLVLHQSAMATTGSPSSEFLLSLALLAPARPFCINISGYQELQADELLLEPIVLACPRLTFYFQLNTLSAEIICHWLHHLPKEEEAKEENEEPYLAQTRLFILDSRLLPSTCAEIIERCKKSLRQAYSPSDRRSFLLSFQPEDPLLIFPLFKLENGASGEVLQLEEWVRGREDIPQGPWPPAIYHLRRCRAAEMANTDKFYRDTFATEPWHSSLLFRTPGMDNGLRTPSLELQY